MNIVIALKNFPAVNQFCLGFVLALCRNRGDHTIILALDGLYAQTVERIREIFDGTLPQKNIHLWHSPARTLNAGVSEANCRNIVGELIRDGLLKSLKPDIVLMSAEIDADGRLGLSGPLGAIPRIGNDLDEQARAALEALEVRHKQDPEGSSGAEIPKQRPKMAYLSPLPPEHSGISDYSAELLPELLHHYEIEVIVEQKKVSDTWILEHCVVRTVSWFRIHACSYDRVLYHFGNSPFHLHMFDLLAEVPGVVVLHDFFISDILEYRDNSGLAPGSFPSALYRSHGYGALQQLYAKPDSARDIVANYPCNIDIVQHATGIIVHSGYARSIALSCYGNEQNNRIVHFPLLRSPALAVDRNAARRTLGFHENDIVVCSFGLPDSHKLSHQLLEAWKASNLMDDGNCYLLFVGELLPNDYCRTLQEDINQSSGRIRMTGWIPLDEYRQYLSAADIGVQLRTMSRGESSASALDCMNYGIATIVNANGSMAELPAECVMMLPDAVTVDNIKGALETLRSDPSLRQRLGSNARSYILTERSPARIAGCYAAAIEAFSQSPEAIRSTLVKQVAYNKTVPDDEASLISIADTLSKTFPAPTQRQLLIDVSALVLVDLKTGIQRVVRSIVKTLIDNPPQGFRIEPVYASPEGPYRYARKFTLKSLDCPEQVLDDDIVEVKPKDILFVPDLHFQVVQGQRDYFVKLRNIGVSVFFLVHDILPIRHPEYFPEGTFEDFQQWLRVVVQTDGAICVSRTVAEDLHCWLNQVRPDRQRPFAIGWNHHGADIAASIPSTGLPDGFDKTLRNLAKAPTILMVGTVEPRKGHLQVLKACELLWIRGIKMNLVIVGKDGWMVNKTAKRLKLHNRRNPQFVWYQNISDEALQRLYNAADGILMASVGEGFGLPLIEAAQHGCPILARDLPVFREVAGPYASYFSGTSALKLAGALRSWLRALKNNSAPQSSAMPWMTWKESADQLVTLLTDKQNPQWLYQWKPDTSTALPQSAMQQRVVNKTPKCIAVDLTLVLPGGENGGAKVFLLELLRELPQMKPDTQFIVLTRESSHHELAFLDRPNMRRIMVQAEPSSHPDHEKHPLPPPSWAVRTVQRWKRSVKKRIKKQELSSEGRLEHLGVELLFSPFTSLDHAEPGIPAVCTIHDLQNKTYPEFFATDDNANRDRMFTEACRKSTLIAAISEYSRSSAITHGNLDPSRIKTIHHRIAHRMASTNGVLESTLFGRLGLVKKEYLLYPANFWKHKNHELLLSAFDIATRNGLSSAIKLVCTGAPDERQKGLIEKARAMNLEKRVLFPGYLPDNELAVLLSNCIGLIFPSLYEGFGLPVIEAMASRIPVACSNTRALPEVTSGAALLFNPEHPEEIAKAMVALAEDESLRLRLIDAGLTRAHEFSDSKRMAQEYWELFEEAINRY